MEHKENHEKNECRKKIKQEITIPFQWEEAPGAPKKDWKPKRSRKPVTPVPLQVKYVASVPFKWEEKPGTPLRTFARDPTKTQTEREGLETKNLPLPPGYFYRYEESDGDSSYSDDYDDDDQDWMSELEFEAMSVQSEESESFRLDPSVANRLTPLQNSLYVEQQTDRYDPFEAPFSPLQNNRYAEQQSDGYDPFEGPFSPESRKSPVNYAADNASLAFLSRLFPLNPPESSFLNKGKTPMEIMEIPERKPTFLEEYKKLGDGKQSGVIRRPCTLGELIMQSRRRNNRRKAVNMKNKNQQKTFAKNKPQGCFDIVASGEGLAKMLRKKFLALKFS